MEIACRERLDHLLREHQQLGVQFSIDDFGTGISAPKIDQSFVGNIATGPDETAIVTAVITPAHSLNLKVMATGVENAQQLAYLRARRSRFLWAD